MLPRISLDVMRLLLGCARTARQGVTRGARRRGPGPRHMRGPRLLLAHMS